MHYFSTLLIFSVYGFPVDQSKSSLPACLQGRVLKSNSLPPGPVEALTTSGIKAEQGQKSFRQVDLVIDLRPDLGKVNDNLNGPSINVDSIPIDHDPCFTSCPWWVEDCGGYSNH